MNPSYIITDNSITIVVGGKPYTMQSNHASFNEVFITDLRVPEADRIGEEGEP